MKNLILKYIAGAALKAAVAYALRLVAILQDALNGVLTGDNLADETRDTIASVHRGIAAVHVFLQRLAAVFGIAPVAPLSLSQEVRKEEIERLRKRLEGIVL